ncbi:hypothetical protein F4678DRAFT_199151 [Xylaria arbuscula]|nr:hypothetical protein F4678DRAFT_199151 [Xylaria arbuscula]
MRPALSANSLVIRGNGISSGLSPCFPNSLALLRCHRHGIFVSFQAGCLRGCLSQNIYVCCGLRDMGQNPKRQRIRIGRRPRLVPGTWLGWGSCVYASLSGKTLNKSIDFLEGTALVDLKDIGTQKTSLAPVVADTNARYTGRPLPKEKVSRVSRPSPPMHQATPCRFRKPLTRTEQDIKSRTESSKVARSRATNQSKLQLPIEPKGVGLGEERSLDIRIA